MRILMPQKNQPSLTEAEIALKHYQSLYDFAPMGYLVLDHKGIITQANLEGARLLGLDRAILTGRRFDEFVALSERKLLEIYIKNMISALPVPAISVNLIRENLPSLYVQMNGFFSVSENEYHLVILDISEKKHIEESLKLFKTVIESSHEAIAITDPTGRFVYINPAHEKLFGRTLDEARDLNYRDYYPPQSVDTLNQIVAPMLARGEGWEGELEVFDVHGRHFPLWERADTVCDHNGNLLFSFGMMRDISQDKQVEAWLRENEQMFRAIFEKNRAIQLLIDPVDGTIVDSNNASAKFYGYSSSQLNELSLTAISTSPQTEIHANMVKTLYEEQSYYIEQHRLADGEIRTVEIYSSPIKTAGRILLHAIIHDITERKKTEMALLASEEKYEQLFNHSTDGIAMLDETGRVIEWNGALERIFGIKRTQAEGRDFFEIQSTVMVEDEKTAHVEQQTKLMKLALQTGESPILNTVLESSYKSTDGDVKFGQQSIFSIKTQQGFRIGIVSRDVTERKQAEEALKKSEALYHLLADHMADVIWLRNLDLSLIYISPSEERIRGFTLAELQQMPIVELLRPDSVNAAVELYKTEMPKVLADPTYSPIHTMEFDFYLRDGSIHSVESKISIIRDDNGNPISILGQDRDITERKKAEAALKVAHQELETALAREQKLARTDELTRVYNRRYLFELAEHEFKVAKRYQQSLSVIMFDLDHFKKINDTFGHTIGDLVLQRVTKAVSSILRSTDLIGRYGGEEFVILLPMTGMKQAYALAERIRRKTEKIRIRTEKGIVTVTMSIGIVELDQQMPNNSVELLIRSADEKMYAAKQAGRNCIVA
jgi:diguanylate cyclase (GGDEF)-like protein/PAS domain S-box-containing protein